MKITSQKVLGLLKRSLTPNRPYHAQWLLTRRCNYRCQSCGVWREPGNKDELSLSEIQRGLDVLRKLGVVELVLSGGNPLLRDDIGEIIDYASRYFITTVYDNGSMVAKKVDAVRNADFVAISLDTLDEKKFDYLKGVKGSWKRAMEGIDTLQKEGVSVAISPTISQLNLYEIADLTKHFVSRGVPVLYCLYSYDYPTEDRLFGIGKKNDELEITDRQAMVEVCDGLMKIKENQKGLFITVKVLKALKQFFSNGQRTWSCQALRGFFIVDHLGRVAGCHLRQPVASVNELADLWDTETFENLRREYSGCENCTYLCYIFYSMYGNILDNLGIVRDQWKNVGLLRARQE
ncbi:MAG: radical SAM protein [Candidatus Bathyarchaeota archaeon]|nr:MAG: radical SAM protein [Candidatus Bathyarchaeota archaeon]